MRQPTDHQSGATATGSGLEREWWAETADVGQIVRMAPTATLGSAAGRDPEGRPMKPHFRVNVEVKADVAACLRAIAWIIAAVGSLLT